MIELISVPALLSRPRYINEGYLSTRLWWGRDEEVALKALCEDEAPLEKSAISLGRSPTRDTGLRLPKEWTAAIIKRRPPAIRNAPLMQYPYIAKVRGAHVDLLAVNSLVPEGLPHHMRADVCQEIMLALWQKETSIEELRSDRSLVNKFIKGARAINYEADGYADDR